MRIVSLLLLTHCLTIAHNRIINQPVASAINHPGASGINQPLASGINQSLASAISQPLVAAINTPLVGAVNHPLVAAINTPHVEAVTDPLVTAINIPHVNAINNPVEEDVTLTSSNDDGHMDVESTEEDVYPMGEDFIYDDEVLQELMHDRHGTARSETELTISTLIGSNTKVAGNT